MSRIQEILAKAERDGTVARTHTVTTNVPAAPVPTARIASPFDGTAALNHPAFMRATAASAAADTLDAPSIPDLPQAEPRMAHATLHPALVAAIEPHSPAAEEYRTIRARLTQHDDRGPLRTILVTSPGAGDGKSITAANLALAMAQEFQRTVLLIDADLRAPSVHALFGIDPGPGLADVLAGDVPIEDALVNLPEHGLTVLPAGTAPQFPTELLGSGEMRRTLDALCTRFDRILLDMPAVVPLADVGTLGPLVDGAVMVVRAGITQRPALDEALAALEPDKLLGVVLNDVN